MNKNQIIWYICFFSFFVFIFGEVLHLMKIKIIAVLNCVQTLKLTYDFYEYKCYIFVKNFLFVIRCSWRVTVTILDHICVRRTDNKQPLGLV